MSIEEEPEQSLDEQSLGMLLNPLLVDYNPVAEAEKVTRIASENPHIHIARRIGQSLGKALAYSGYCYAKIKYPYLTR